MPRDGSGVYHTPAGTDGVPDTTISSSAYNTNVHDVETDLNTTRPIVAGGTGATSASAALANLSGETAKQFITDFNTATILPGSFYCATSAANAPVAAHAFAGFAYLNDASNLVLEARDITDTAHMVYYRIQTGGVWGAWTVDAGAVGTNAVLYSSAQTLTPTQQLQAANNMAVPSGAGAQTLTTDSGTTMGQRSQARSNIYAAPFDALAYNGMQINGSCEVSQERGNTVVALTNNLGAYIQDGWKASSSSAGALRCQIGGAQAASPTSGLGLSVAMQATTGASLGAGDYVLISHIIEGYRLARLGWGTSGAMPVSIGFWITTTIPGTMAVAARNAGNNRSYITNVVINSANVWQYVTLTIPGETTGTWDAASGIGMELDFCLGSGSNFQGAANSWLTTGMIATSATTNFMATTNNLCRITGLIVLPGLELPSAARAPFIMRPYGQELQTCKRYLLMPQFAGQYMLSGYAATTTQGSFPYVFPVTMRAVPTFSTNNAAAFSVTGPGFQVGCSTITVGALSVDGGRLNGNVASGLTVGAAIFQGLTTGGTLTFDARL